MPAPTEPAAWLEAAAAARQEAAAQQAARPTGGPAAGYSVLLPPGWRVIPLGEGRAKAITAILDEVFARLGPGQSRDTLIRHRIALEQHLTRMAESARRAAGIDMYLPVEYVHGMAIPASFVVSLKSGLPGGNPADVIAALAEEQPGAVPVTVDGAPGLRAERTAPPDPAADLPFGSRRVDYTIAVPQQPGHWLVSVFSTPGDGDPDGEFARILTELFDAVMSTFRWTTQ